MTNNKFEDELIAIMPALRSYALRLTANEENAKDLLQDAVLRALIYKAMYRNDDNFKGWMQTILFRLFTNNYHHMQKQAMKAVDMECCERLLAVYNGYDLFDLPSMIDSLPEIYSNIFKLYLAGYKYDDIAEMLSLSAGTVKSRIHACRAKLRSEFS